MIKIDNRPIGMFDSGIGGITVFKEVRARFPKENIIYLGDTKHFPYGDKSAEEIIELAKKNIDFLISKNVKAIIIACGTATSQALDIVSPLYDIPIIGIIKPTVEYIKSEINIHRVGIVATAGTIRSNSWQKSLLSVRNDLEIINKACPLLAPMAEEESINNNLVKSTIHDYMQNFKNVDALILGCTHFPLFENIFKMELNDDTEIINTGKMVANNLSNIFESGILGINTSNISDSKIFLTTIKSNFIHITSKILEQDIDIEKCTL